MHVITSITEAEDGVVWFGAKGGLLRIAPGDSTFIYVVPTLGGTDEFIDVYKVISADSGALWLSTDQGLVHFNPKALNLSTGMLPREVSSFHINAITKTSRGDLWLAFDKEGLGCLRTDGSFQHFKHDEEDINSIPNNSIRSILEDQFGNIWLSTATGISKITAD